MITCQNVGSTEKTIAIDPKTHYRILVYFRHNLVFPHALTTVLCGLVIMHPTCTTTEPPPPPPSRPVAQQAAARAP